MCSRLLIKTVLPYVFPLLHNIHYIITKLYRIISLIEISENEKEIISIISSHAHLSRTPPKAKIHQTTIQSSREHAPSLLVLRDPSYHNHHKKQWFYMQSLQHHFNGMNMIRVPAYLPNLNYYDAAGGRRLRLHHRTEAPSFLQKIYSMHINKREKMHF